MMQKIKGLFKKYRELITYVIFGALTTLVNIVVYWPLRNLNTSFATITAWIVSVAFAFFTNKLFVFESKSFKANVFWPELTKFVGGRFSTGVLDWLIMTASIDWFNPDAGDLYRLTWKVISNVIVIILNFVISKLLIFRKEKDGKNEASGNEN